MGWSCGRAPGAGLPIAELPPAAPTAAEPGDPQQCLYFRPLPHGQGSFRPVFTLSSCLAVALQRISERPLERLEPRLKVFPLIEPVPVDRLPYLL